MEKRGHGKRKRCPVERMGKPCKKTYETLDGLGGHLYYGHIKSELVKWIMAKVKEEQN